jgi:putative glutamine amidotransferase
MPIASSLGLSLSENQEYLKLISEKFPFLVAMGGDDVDPSRYHQENLHSRNVIPERDRFEIQMIKAYTQNQKGFLLGVCRGSQISSVALGYSLNQHVPFHIGTDVAHGNDWHDIKTFKTEHNILSKLAGDKGLLRINSLHHQSIRYVEGGPLQLAAVSPDGVTEALEFRNGRGILLQFHPELMGNALGAQIISEVVKQKSRVQVGSCRRIFN